VEGGTSRRTKEDEADALVPPPASSEVLKQVEPPLGCEEMRLITRFVLRLARVSARTGYESSPSRRFRQSHPADFASRQCDHRDQYLREDGHAGRRGCDEKVGVEVFPGCSQNCSQTNVRDSRFGSNEGERERV
jgi:hypothetical protein